MKKLSAFKPDGNFDFDQYCESEIPAVPGATSAVTDKQYFDWVQTQNDEKWFYQSDAVRTNEIMHQPGGNEIEHQINVANDIWDALYIPCGLKVRVWDGGNDLDRGLRSNGVADGRGVFDLVDNKLDDLYVMKSDTWAVKNNHCYTNPNSKYCVAWCDQKKLRPNDGYYDKICIPSVKKYCFDKRADGTKEACANSPDLTALGMSENCFSDASTDNDPSCIAFCKDNKCNFAMSRCERLSTAGHFILDDEVCSSKCRSGDANFSCDALIGLQCVGANLYRDACSCYADASTEAGKINFSEQKIRPDIYQRGGVHPKCMIPKCVARGYMSKEIANLKCPCIGVNVINAAGGNVSGISQENKCDTAVYIDGNGSGATTAPLDPTQPPGENPAQENPVPEEKSDKKKKLIIFSVVGLVVFILFIFVLFLFW